MELEELIPESSEFNLASTGETHIIRPLTLEDEIWLKKELGDRLGTIFDAENLDMEAITLIAYHQLTDKKPFRAVDHTSYNDEGEEINTRVGGLSLFRKSIMGVEEQVGLINALAACFFASRADQKKQGGAKKKQKGNPNSGGK